MFFNGKVVAFWALSLGGASAFSTSSKGVAFLARSSSGLVSRTQSAGFNSPSSVSFHPAGCQCGSCSSTHSASCNCGPCRKGTVLFADVTEEVPAEVEALDGVESTEEAHNVDRPARSSLKKKRAPKGRDISEFEVDSMVKGTVRTITTYGAFVDIGASTDGLLHISQLSSEYVGDVTEMLSVGQEVDVRVVSVDANKGQIALSLMTVQEAEESVVAAKQKRENNRSQKPPRRDDSSVLKQLKEKGWDETTFVDGKVVSTVDFGCFVRIDASRLNEQIEGEFDGLVHISAMSTNRVASVTDVVKPEDDVKVRVKTITGNKVGLTMLSIEDEEFKQDSQPAGANEGAKDWKESYEKFDTSNPTFKNGPVVVDLRK